MFNLGMLNMVKCYEEHLQSEILVLFNVSETAWRGCTFGILVFWLLLKGNIFLNIYIACKEEIMTLKYSNYSEECLQSCTFITL